MAKSGNNSDDNYEDDGSHGFEKEDEDDEIRLEKIKKAMVKEN